MFAWPLSFFRMLQQWYPRSQTFATWLTLLLKWASDHGTYESFCKNVYHHTHKYLNVIFSLAFYSHSGCWKIVLYISSALFGSLLSSLHSPLWLLISRFWIGWQNEKYMKSHFGSWSDTWLVGLPGDQRPKLCCSEFMSNPTWTSPRESWFRLSSTIVPCLSAAFCNSSQNRTVQLEKFALLRRR